MGWIILCVWALMVPVSTASGQEYQLYKNSENFGIVVFPKRHHFPELDQYFRSLVFESVSSGKAVMRFGSKGENETLMMPLQVQREHAIEKFIVIQILADHKMLVGIFDPEWGLTLPSSTYLMDAVKQNIPKTLNIFRGSNPRKQTRFDLHKGARFYHFAGTEGTRSPAIFYHQAGGSFSHASV